ncbi:MAG: hypothetical protein WA902_15955, partial [Thermosynechococcaceae cyanobacterium]
MSIKKVVAAVIKDSGSLALESIDADYHQIGQKAVGLTSIPKSWVPKWLSIPFATCEAVLSGRVQWIDISTLVVRAFSGTTNLIVRSSSSTESLDARGSLDSKVCPCDANQLAQVLHDVSLQQGNAFSSPDNASTIPVCAPIVQVYLSESILGHLSNEYRHAQRNVDFLYEVEQRPDSLSHIEIANPQSFRLDRPVQLINTQRRIYLSNSNTAIKSGLRSVGRWIASNELRAHVEWLVHRNEMYVVQFDIDQLPPRIKPMSQCPQIAHSPLVKNLQCFSCLRPEGKYADLRKTRSHYLLGKVGAFVPPIYIFERICDFDWSRQLPSSISEDLKVLCELSPLIVRFDVPRTRTDWTNLPTIGPSSDAEDIGQKICDAIQKLQIRGITLQEITLVAHHFIAAKASAWSEARPDSEKVRIDAVWGLPDGLQTFAHDSYIWDLKQEILKPDERYKDRFLDVEIDGKWTTRRAYPKLAREGCCETASIIEISQITANIASLCDGPVRIMWFLDVISGADGKSIQSMPWIV